MVISGNTARIVLLEPLWKARQDHADLLQYAPDGYRFVVREGVIESVARRLSHAGLAWGINWGLLRFLPVNLAKAYLDRFQPVPPEIDLIYAVIRPVFRRQPWVLDMQAEQPYLLVGGEAVFHRWRRILRSALISTSCRRIICGVEAGRRALLQATRWPELEEKVIVVPPAAPRKEFMKRFDHNRVKLLFVNSANINADQHFLGRGGPVLLEAFRHLRQSYPNVELVIRSRLPRSLREQYRGMPGLTVYEEVVPWAELEREFISADIFVCPTHVTPYRVFPDAMSYELPVVTTDVWGNPELVQDGRTGLLVRHPKAREYTDGFVVRYDSRAWRQITTTVDHELVRGLLDKIRFLIEAPERRRQMGRAARHEVEEGRFSILRRSQVLRSVLDAALTVRVPSGARSRKQ